MRLGTAQEQLFEFKLFRNQLLQFFKHDDPSLQHVAAPHRGTFDNYLVNDTDPSVIGNLSLFLYM